MASIELKYSLNTECSGNSGCNSGDTHSLSLCPENYKQCPLYIMATNPELYKQLFQQSRVKIDHLKSVHE